MRIITLILLAVIPSLIWQSQNNPSAQKKDYQVAVYYFPNYHPDSINARWHGNGWTEWEVVKAAKPRFPGHHQRQPLLSQDL